MDTSLLQTYPPHLSSNLHLADPAGAGDPVRAEAGRDEETPHVGLAEDELAVGRERLGPVDHLHDLGLLQVRDEDRKSTRLNSSHSQISYAVFCLKKKTIA